MAKANRFTDRGKEKFLAVLANTCNVSEAAREVGISRTSAYEHRKNDEDFAASWDEAEATATDALEREARRRAIEGVDEPVFYKGEVVGQIRKYSDRMLELLLKAHRPEKYRERHEVTGAGGGPLTVEIVRFGADPDSE